MLWKGLSEVGYAVFGESAMQIARSPQVQIEMCGYRLSLIRRKRLAFLQSFNRLLCSFGKA